MTANLAPCPTANARQKLHPPPREIGGGLHVAPTKAPHLFALC